MECHKFCTRREEEKYFFELFQDILVQAKEERVTGQQIFDAIENIVAHFRQGPTGACAIHNFPTFASRLGYFYWSSIVSAGVTRNKTLNAISNCAEFRECFDQESLNLVSVGGGTGSDLVGLYSALYENSAFENMHVLVIDNNSNWKPFFTAVHGFLDLDDYGDASNLIQSRNIGTSFMTADMRVLSDDVRFNMRDADIVWMKGIRSILEDDDERNLITDNVISSMNKGALLVVIDSRAYDNSFTFRDRLKRIFYTNEGENYILPNYDSKFRVCRTTNQEISIFRRL